MSLRTTSMSAAAIAWAISPPIVPAPTTAALKTNIPLLTWVWGSARLPVRLEPKGAERALQRASHLAADEEQIGDRGEDAAALDLVLEALGDARQALRAGGERRHPRRAGRARRAR